MVILFVVNHIRERILRIVYDKTQTMEKGLVGWPEPNQFIPEKTRLSPPEMALWRFLAPEQLSNNPQVSKTMGEEGFPGQLFLVEEATESQYDILRNFPPDINSPLACVALSGSGFHGQRQRSWQALPGNLHLSLSVPLNLESGPRALTWTMLPAVAVMRALNDLGFSDHCGIKWVNDILCASRKLAGVISALTIAEGRIRRGYLGIGLNVAQTPQIDVETCCLHQHLTPEQAPLGKVLHAVLSAVTHLVTLFKNGQDDLIFHEYLAHCLVVGHQVRIMSDPSTGSPTEICHGKVLAINPDLSLLIEGHESPIHHGRLVFLK